MTVKAGDKAKDFALKSMIKRKAREIDARGEDKQSQEQKRIVKESRTSRTNILIPAIVMVSLLVGFMMFAPADDPRDAHHKVFFWQ